MDVKGSPHLVPLPIHFGYAPCQTSGYGTGAVSIALGITKRYTGRRISYLDIVGQSPEK
jgi:hypothetical protein